MPSIYFYLVFKESKSIIAHISKTQHELKIHTRLETKENEGSFKDFETEIGMKEPGKGVALEATCLKENTMLKDFNSGHGSNGSEQSQVAADVVNSTG